MKAADMFDRAALLLPEKLRAQALFLDRPLRAGAEEIRLRSGLGACITLDGCAYPLKGAVGSEEIGEVLEKASRSSIHSVQESLRAGYLTAPGGFRIGVCGTMALKDGAPAGFRQVSSLCIRIPRERRCVTPELVARLRDASVLVIAPPGAGKTTFLRELMRCVSDSGRRMALVDERSELAAMESGRPQFDVGCNTDVLELCPKALAAEMLLRSMSPQTVVMDELAFERDWETVRRLRSCGVEVYASMHGAGAEDLRRHRVEEGLFSLTVTIQRQGKGRSYLVEEYGL